jgi:hypothetical protein
MAEGFKIADAYVEIDAEIDEDGIRRKSKGAGEKAGRDMGEGLGNSAGRTLGGTLSGHLPTIFSSPPMLAGIAIAGASIAPALGAAISAGLLGATGVGLIAAGIASVANDPRITKAGTDIKNKFMGQFRRASLPFIEPTLKALGEFNKLLDRSMPKITKMMDSLAKSGAIEGLTKGLTGLVDNALPGFVKLGEASGPFLRDAGPGLAELGKGLGAFATSIAKVGPEAAVFFNDLIGFLSGQIAFWGKLIEWLTLAYSAMRGFFTSIPGWISSAVGAVTGWWNALFERGRTVVAWLAALPGRIGGFFAGIGAAIAARGATVLNWFQALPGRIGAFLASLPAKLAALFARTFDAVTTAIGFGIGTAVRLALTMPGRIVSAITSLSTRLFQLFMQAMTMARNAFNTGVAAIVNFARQLPGKVYAAAISLVSRLASVISQARSRAVSLAGTIVSGVVNLIQTLPGKAASALGSFGSRVAGALRGAVSSAFSIGADIIRGVMNGITSMIGAAVATAKRAVGNIVSGAKKGLGIGSPSKVMADEVGRWILPGVTQGVAASLPAARREVAGMTGALVPGVAPGGLTQEGAGTSAGGASYYFAPGSIVIDASKLKSIDDLLAMIDGLKRTARAMRPRSATVGV